MKHICSYLLKYRLQGDFLSGFDHETLSRYYRLHRLFAKYVSKLFYMQLLLTPVITFYELQMKYICSNTGCKVIFSADSIMRHLADITDYIDFSLNMFQSYSICNCNCPQL